MASGALFGSAAGGRSQSKNLVEFRAGKMFMKGQMVHPDKRKGQVYVYQSDDSLMHFCWKDRTSGAVEDDLIIFPDDIEFKHVPQCNTGRIYLLKFKLSSRKFFFWMQEPKSDKDEDHCKKVNDFLNNPPTPGSNRSGGSGGGGMSGIPPELQAAGLGDNDLQSILGSMSQQQLMQLLGGMGMGNLGGLSALMGGRSGSAQSTDSSTPLRVQSSPGPRSTSETPAAQSVRPVTAAGLPTATATATATPPVSTAPAPTPGAPVADRTSSRSQIQLSDLQTILSGMTVPGGEEGGSNIDLSSAISPESLIPVLANQDVQKRLMEFMPEGETLPKTEAELRSTVQSPQFQQAMSSFSAALASGQLGPLMGQFGFPDDVSNAAAAGDVEAFVKAMQSHEKKDGEKKEEKKEEKKDEK